MYAIIANGSKQYKAEVDSIIKFEKLDAKVGDIVEFDVLLVSDEGAVKVGSEVSGLKAKGEVLDEGMKGKKIIVYKYKSKKNERKKQGHRQPYTSVKIVSIG